VITTVTMTTMTDVTVVNLVTGYGWIAPVPRCPVHGQLHYRSETEPCGADVRIFTVSEWACHGWDGEGCGYSVDHGDLDWTPAGPEDWPRSRPGG
jgi:hypothetical protein